MCSVFAVMNPGLLNSVVFNLFAQMQNKEKIKDAKRKKSFFFFCLLSSFCTSSPPPYRWSQAAFNNPMHSHASTPQATPLMLHYSHTHTVRQCQFPRQDPCLSSPDWISLVQRGAVTLGLRALHGPAGSHVGLK